MTDTLTTNQPAPTQASTKRTPVLQIRALTRKYGDFVALDALNLDVHEGEVCGYIGPNGAGKTTTFRILCGLLVPTSGSAHIAGEEVTGSKDRIKQLVGFLPDNFGVYPNLRVWEYLDFFAAAYRIPPKQRKERIQTCLTITNTEDLRNKLMGALSRGMKQRVGIAKTLLHDPKLLILDEPAATLDPRARVQMRQLLRELAALGKAVLVSSHILPELADVCDTVAILSRGKLLAAGPVHEVLRHTQQHGVVEIQIIGSIEPARQVIEGGPGTWKPIEFSEVAGKLKYEVDATEDELADTLQFLLQAGVRVVSFYEVPVDLEDAYMHFTE